MGRHIIGAFARMRVGKFLRCNGIERRFEVSRDIGISILIDRKRCRRVLKKDI